MTIFIRVANTGDFMDSHEHEHRDLGNYRCFHPRAFFFYNFNRKKVASFCDLPWAENASQSSVQQRGRGGSAHISTFLSIITVSEICAEEN